MERPATTTQENVLARHKILHELGRGATGAVYAAREATTGAVVALKRVDPALSGSAGAGFGERLLKHARSARHLTHRNIARVHDAGVAAGTVYVASELLEGRSLRSLLDEGPLPLARAIPIVHEIACGLAHAHLEGVVHGGIKPSNIFILRSGAVKITDFGVGQLGQAALLSGARAGGLGYLSPEQVRGDALDHRCDLFSLGALFYEVLTRRAPFAGNSAKEIMESILHAEPPPPSELSPHVPRALDALVSSMLAKQPAARMPGMPVLIRELQRLEDGLGLALGASAASDEPAASVPPAERDPHAAMLVMDRESRPAPPARSRPAVLPALAVLLALLVAGFAGFLHYSSDRGEPGEPSIAASSLPEAPATAAAAPLPAPIPTPVEPVPAEPVLARNESAPAPRQAPIEVPAREPAATAQLLIAISPRGEIYIDGKHRGTTPPITTLDLAPGMHRIEVRNGTRTPYLTYMIVEAGDERRIRHDFNAKGKPPPGSRRIVEERPARGR